MIIFDLDDTLIDTSGTITPFKMRLCLQKLVESGLHLHDFEGAYAELLALNQQSARSREALEQFTQQRNWAREQAEEAFAELTAPLPETFLIPTTPHASEILTSLHSRADLALVTGGNPHFQMEKMKKAGLDSSVFSTIAISENWIKKPIYIDLIQKYSAHPTQVWVCGDRVELDLAPAHELGCKTIHMRWGRGMRQKQVDWIDYSIASLVELQGIIR